MQGVKFTRLHVEQWRQFDSVEIDIHPRLTVITGANGAGKTTLLSFLTGHFGWSRPLLATPWRARNGKMTYLTGALKGLLDWVVNNRDNETHIGAIWYSNNIRASISTPATSDVQYNANILDQQGVSGIYIPSHRILSHYQAIGSIPTRGISAQEAYGLYKGELFNRWHGQHSASSPLFRMKEALISMATFGEGNSYVEGKPELLDAYLGFIEVLKKVLPESLGFQSIAIRTPDVVLVTATGEFLLDSVSGGVNALIDLAWQIYTFSFDVKDFTVIIDEPENHLHPSMQRALLPSLMAAFPSVQFVVATHSPFIVTSVRDSNVIVLSYRDGTNGNGAHSIAPARSVYSTTLDQVNKAGSANDILRDVLGLDSTVPLWASRELKAIVERFRAQPFHGEQVDQLSAELDSLGLAGELPSAINAIFQRSGL